MSFKAESPQIPGEQADSFIIPLRSVCYVSRGPMTQSFQL